MFNLGGIADALIGERVLQNLWVDVCESMPLDPHRIQNHLYDLIWTAQALRAVADT